MRILYHGSFFREGLTKLGHDIRNINLKTNTSLNSLIEQSGFNPDIVFLEIWGKNPLPADIHSCNTRLVAYCIDSCINEFFYKKLMLLFDDSNVKNILPDFKKIIYFLTCLCSLCKFLAHVQAVQFTISFSNKPC